MAHENDKKHLSLSNLKPRHGATKNRKRIGRGHGSGTGETSGKGIKGQKARTGHHGARIGFEGGQMPIQRRLPKRGFKNPFRKDIFAVNVGHLSALPEERLDLDTLKGHGVVPRKIKLVKVLGHGEVSRKMEIHAHYFSKSAEEKILAAGGKIEKLAQPKQETNG
jgi:large subunit ribosomal protein L15